jgi:hypothetical protein
MAGGFHDNERRGRRAQQGQQLLIAVGVLLETRGPLQNGALFIDTADHVVFRADVDPDEAHTRPFRRECREPSDPMSVPALVDARPSSTPRDTVRALDTGRGRQSQNRGLSLKQPTATLSRIPSGAIYPRNA